MRKEVRDHSPFAFIYTIVATVCNHWGQNALEMSFIPCKGIQTVLDSGELLHAVNSVFFVSETWIPDFTVRRDSRFLAPYNGFQKPRIPDSTRKKNPLFRNPDYFTWGDIIVRSDRYIQKYFVYLFSNPLLPPPGHVRMTRSFENLRKNQLEKLAKRSFILPRTKREKSSLYL